MSKKIEKKTNKEVLKEAMQEGLFKEAEDMGKKRYKFASITDAFLICAIIFLGLIVFTLSNHFFGV